MSRHPNELIQEYRERRIREKGELYDKIAQVLFENDPVAINLGDNIDEYELEAGKIISRLKEVADAKSLSKIVREIFLEMFNNDPKLIDWNKPVYDKIAREIWELI